MPFRPPELRNPFHPLNGFQERVVGIYRIFNRISGKSYIGQAASTSGIYGRWYDHWKCLQRGAYSNKHPKLQNAWNKYSASDWVWGIVEICEPQTSILNEREEFWMKHYNAVEGGYNIAPRASTTLGCRLTPEQRQRKSEAMRRMFRERPEERLKRSRPGYKHTEETKEKIRKGNIGKNKGKPAPNKGVPMTEAAKAHLSKLRTGTNMSEETKMKIRAAPKRVWMNDGCNRKRVLKEDIQSMLDTGWVIGKTLKKDN